MKKFNKDDYKKNRDKYPLFQRIVLAILIACVLGLALAANDTSFAATTTSPEATSQTASSNRNSKLIAPDWLPSGNELHKANSGTNIIVKVLGSIVALFAIGVALFDFNPKAVKAKKSL